MTCNKTDTVERHECVNYSADVFIGIVVISCCILGSLMNGFVLKLLGRKVCCGGSTKNRSTGTNTTFFLLCSLALADMGNLLIPSPFNAFTLFYGRYFFQEKLEQLKLTSQVWYVILINVVGWSSNVFVMGSIFLVCIISVRRAIALYIPFKYNSYFKPVNVYAMATLSWIIAILFACLPFYVSSYHKYMAEYGNSIARLTGYNNLVEKGKSIYIAFLFLVTVVMVTIPATIIAITSAMVVVKLHARKQVRYQKVKKSQKVSEDNAARTVTIIPIVFLICHLPVVYRITSVFISAMFGMFDKKAPPAIDHDIYARHYVTMVSHFVLPTINSCINPFVYLLGSNKLRATAGAYAKDYVSKFSRAATCQEVAMNPPDDFEMVNTVKVTNQTVAT